MEYTATQRTLNRLSVVSTATRAHSVPSSGRAESTRRLHTIPPTSTTSHTTPVVAPSHALVWKRAHHAADLSASASQTRRNRRRSIGHSCRHAQPWTAAPIAPKLTSAPAPAIVAVRDSSPSTKSSGSSLPAAAAGGSGAGGGQTVERPHSCPAVRASSPMARAVCRSIAATVPSSFPAS
jgi:hypothetical protein